MKIIVCIKEVIDTALNLDFGLRNSLVFREGLPHRLNPNDAAALSMALGLKSPDDGAKTEITIVSIGPGRVETYLRNGLALGADRAVRIWGKDLANLSPYQKAGLLTAAVSLYGADLVFTGARSLDTGNGQVGLLTAGRLGLPCVSEVVGLEPDKEQNSLNLTRDIGRGEREKVRCPLPAVITVKGERQLPYASLDGMVESKSAEVELLSPADLGISSGELQNDPTRVAGIVSPRPLPRKAPPLDSSLPAFYRILQLLEGGMSKRKGLMLKGGSEELAEQLFELLKEEGVIRPATGQ